MAFNFAFKKEEKKELKLNDESQAYRERAKNERERYNLAVDASFYTCVCFSTDENLKKWQEKVQNFEKFIWYKDLNLKRDGKKSFALRNQKLNTKTIDDPFKNIKYENDLEKDSFKEFEALYNSFNNNDAPNDPIDTKNYIIIYTESNEELDKFLNECSLIKYGYYFLNGDKWLNAM